MSILDDLKNAPSKNVERVGPAIATLAPEEREAVHAAMLDPEITDTWVADLLKRYTKTELTISQVAHYARTRLGRNTRA